MVDGADESMKTGAITALALARFELPVSPLTGGMRAGPVTIGTQCSMRHHFTGNAAKSLYGDASNCATACP